MDIKISFRTWAPEASEDCIKKCLKKDRENTSVPLGFRISGLQIFAGKEIGFWKPGKDMIKNFSVDDVRLVLRKFISYNISTNSDSEPDYSVASTIYGSSTGILAQLLELKAWLEDQMIFHFYSCSILLVCGKELALERRGCSAEVKLIDFAHVVEGNGVIDDNFLGGLCSLITYL